MNGTAGGAGGGEISLGWGADGSPIEIEEGAAHWGVRRMPATRKGGAPEVIYRDGLPLLLDLDADLETLRACVDGRPGKYKLVQMGEDGKPLKDAAPAYVVLGDVGAAPDVDSSDVVGELLRTNREMAQALTRAVEAMASKHGEMITACASLVAAADGAGLPERTPPRAIVRRDGAQQLAPPAPDWTEKLLPHLMPIAQQAGAWLFTKLTNDPDTAAAVEAARQAAREEAIRIAQEEARRAAAEQSQNGKDPPQA